MKMDLNIVSIGWCRDEAKNHDKVWGIILLECGQTVDSRFYSSIDKYLIFWGRRGAALRTKIEIKTKWNVEQQFNAKLRGGYTKIDTNKLHQVYPEFADELRQTTMWAALMNL